MITFHMMMCLFSLGLRCAHCCCCCCCCCMCVSVGLVKAAEVTVAAAEITAPPRLISLRTRRMVFSHVWYVNTWRYIFTLSTALPLPPHASRAERRAPSAEGAPKTSLMKSHHSHIIIMPILFQYRNIRHFLGMYITKQVEQEIYLLLKKVTMVLSMYFTSN